MKKYFLSGFIALLPLALTWMIAQWLFELFTEPLLGVTEQLLVHLENLWQIDASQHRTLALFISRVLALILLLALIFGLGVLARRFFLHLFLKGIDKIFARIPFIRSIYRVTKEITQSFFSDEEKKTFQRTVLMPFPHHEAHAIGFVTGTAPPMFQKLVQADLVVFVPTAPHPMSGFVLLTPQKIAVPTDVSIEDAFKFIISCGVIHPPAP